MADVCRVHGLGYLVIVDVTKTSTDYNHLDSVENMFSDAKIPFACHQDNALVHTGRTVQI